MDVAIKHQTTPCCFSNIQTLNSTYRTVCPLTTHSCSETLLVSRCHGNLRHELIIIVISFYTTKCLFPTGTCSNLQYTKSFEDNCFVAFNCSNTDSLQCTKQSIKNKRRGEAKAREKYLLFGRMRNTFPLVGDLFLCTESNQKWMVWWAGVPPLQRKLFPVMLLTLP